ncbi:MAG: DUF6776 family protein [Casimicrobiaceae bacterium]
MAVSGFWHRVRTRFGIGESRTAVATPMPWWGRIAALVAGIAVITGMWWWGFDFGQVFGGFDRKEVEARLSTLDAEAARLRTEAADLRGRNSRLESDLAMSRGAEQGLSRQSSNLVTENAQLKEEVAFLQRLVADSSKQAGLSIPRLTIDVDPDGTYRYNLIVVRGGNPKGDFEGHVALQAALSAPDGEVVTLTLPDDQPETRAGLDLRFKYYQRIEGTLRLPPGSRLTALIARAYEDGNTSPRATRSLTAL